MIFVYNNVGCVYRLISGLPYFLRQFTYLVCRSLRNLASQCSGTITDSYTDLLLLFTPALFPGAVGDVQRFLRAARLTLVLIDRCEHVFQLSLSTSANDVHSDETFFRGLLLFILFA